MNVRELALPRHFADATRAPSRRDTFVVVMTERYPINVLGVIDGAVPKGVEGAEEAEKWRGFRRMIGYKR